MVSEEYWQQLVDALTRQRNMALNQLADAQAQIALLIKAKPAQDGDQVKENK